MMALLIKFKWYLIAAGVLILISFTIWFNIVLKQNKTLKLENNRLSNNQTALIARNSNYEKLVLTYKEAQRQNIIRIDSLSKLIKVKPKEITKVVEKTIVQLDTVERLIQTNIITKDVWKLSDSGKCFEWGGIAKLIDDSLKVTRTLFNYHNKTDDIFWEHRKFNFWFIHLGKKQTYQQSTSECGTSKTIEINIIRR
jgi:hypothetical protein